MSILTKIRHKARTARGKTKKNTGPHHRKPAIEG
jgi:hypothetical protein